VWKRNTQPPRFQVGDWVALRFGVKKAIAQVIEQRGTIGVEQKHFYRIRLDRLWAEPDQFEMPEDELEPAPPPT
jgi:hypothetical protein